MIRTALEYHRPQSLDEASAVLLEHYENVAVLGGGTFLLPEMTRHAIEVEHIVDLKDLGLDAITNIDGMIEVGARVSYGDVINCDMLRSELPLLPRMAGGITGGRQLTQQATLVGAACCQFPTTDAPGVLWALDALFGVHGPEGGRTVPINRFFLDALLVDLGPGEFVATMRFARQPAGGYCKVKHSTGSWPIVTASALPDRSGGLRVTMGALQALPLSVVVDDAHDREELRHSVEAAITAPWSDVLAPGSYRADIAAAVASRAADELQGV
jgi:carbon-monoxide dehydrogenase medium subunit